MILRKRLTSSNKAHGSVLEVLTFAAEGKPLVYCAYVSKPLPAKCSTYVPKVRGFFANASFSGC